MKLEYDPETGDCTDCNNHGFLEIMEGIGPRVPCSTCDGASSPGRFAIHPRPKEMDEWTYDAIKRWERDNNATMAMSTYQRLTENGRKKCRY